jgi:hypothetical protein
VGVTDTTVHLPAHWAIAPTGPPILPGVANLRAFASIYGDSQTVYTPSEYDIFELARPVLRPLRNGPWENFWS